jgi:flagellar biosynthesis/type III secretory pathway protein FliH
MSAVPDTIEAAIDLANETYQAGFAAGRDIGFNEGLQAVQDLIGGKTPEQIIMERRVKQENGDGL